MTVADNVDLPALLAGTTPTGAQAARRTPRGTWHRGQGGRGAVPAVRRRAAAGRPCPRAGESAEPAARRRADRQPGQRQHKRRAPPAAPHAPRRPDHPHGDARRQGGGPGRPGDPPFDDDRRRLQGRACTQKASRRPGLPRTARLTVRGALRWVRADLRVHRAQSAMTVAVIAGVVAALVLAVMLSRARSTPGSSCLTGPRARTRSSTSPGPRPSQLHALPGVTGVAAPYDAARGDPGAGRAEVAGAAGRDDARAARDVRAAGGRGHLAAASQPDDVVIEASFAAAATWASVTRSPSTAWTVPRSRCG